MAQEIINIGSAPDDHTGEEVRLAFEKANRMFDELFSYRSFIRPLDWIDISSVGDNEINLLVGETGIGFLVTLDSGTYSIDWGDGVIETDLEGGATVRQHLYSINGTWSEICKLYTWKIRIFGATGNITSWKIAKHSFSNKTPQTQGILEAVFGTKHLLDFSYAFAISGGAVKTDSLVHCTLPTFDFCSNASYAFSYCSSLVSLTFPETFGSITNLQGIFYNCSSLQTVTLPASWGEVTNIGSLFQSCSSLFTVTLPVTWGNVTFASQMFYGCGSLRSITLPTSWGNITTLSQFVGSCVNLMFFSPTTDWGAVTNVSSMFSFCIKLNTVTLPGVIGNITLASSMFVNCFNLRSVININYLGSSSLGCDFTNIFQSCELMDTDISLNCLVKAISCQGAIGFTQKFKSLRLLNPSNIFDGSSSPINISYTAFSASALLDLMNDLPGLSSKTLVITGIPALEEEVIKTSITTANGDPKIYMTDTSGLSIGMEAHASYVTSPRSATLTTGLNSVRISLYTPVDGEKVSFTTSVAGLIANKIYYARFPNSGAFLLSETPTGTIVPITLTTTASIRFYPRIISISPNANIVLSAPAYASGTSTVIFSFLQRSIVLLKGWTITS